MVIIVIRLATVYRVDGPASKTNRTARLIHRVTPLEVDSGISMKSLLNIKG